MKIWINTLQIVNKKPLILQKILQRILLLEILFFYVANFGSGKTKFVQGVLRHFNLENEISSPTFTIVNEYISENINIYHFDVYRLEGSDEFYAMGGDEYFSNGICLIEWGEIIEDILPKPYTKIVFKKDDDNPNNRELNIEIIS